MVYYFIRFLVDNDIYINDYVAVQPNEWLRSKDDGQELQLQDGQPIKIIFPPFRKRPNTDNRKFVEHIENAQCLCVLRDDVARIIEELEPNNVQLIKIDLQHNEPPSDQDYYYVHTLNNVTDGLDKNQSDMVPLVEGYPIYSEIRNFTLNLESVSGRHFFRIQEQRGLLIVSERLKTRLEERDFEYIAFTPCQGFHWKLSPDPVEDIDSIRKKTKA